MIVFLMVFGGGMARLRSVEIFFTVFFLSYPNEREVKFGFGYANREIMSVMD